MKAMTMTVSGDDVSAETCSDYDGLVFIDESTSVTCVDAGSRYPWKCYEQSHARLCCQTCARIRQDKPGLSLTPCSVMYFALKGLLSKVNCA